MCYTYSRCLVHQILHVFLSLLVCVCGLGISGGLLHDALRHLFVVSSRWESILGRRNGLAEVLVVEIGTLEQKDGYRPAETNAKMAGIDFKVNLPRQER